MGLFALHMNVNLRQLRAFIAGVQSNSFSEAAERMGITQPGFSLLIRQLEEELGLRLFDRTTRRVEVTSEGLEFYDRIARILDDLDDACQDMTDLRLLRRGRVRIAILPSAGATILPPLLSRMVEEHPDIEVSIVERLAEPLQESVENEEVDFGIGTRPSKASNLRFEPLLKDRLVCLCHENDPLAQIASPSWEDLSKRPFIGFSGNTSIEHQVRVLSAQLGSNLLRRSEISGLNTALGLVRSGVGITLIPELALGGLDLSGLVLRALEGPAAQREIGLIMLRRRSRSPATLAVLDMFQRSGAAIGNDSLARFKDLPRIALSEVG